MTWMTFTGTQEDPYRTHRQTGHFARAPPRPRNAEQRVVEQRASSFEPVKVMQNQSSSNTTQPIEETEPESRRRARHARKGWRRGPILAAGAVAAIGAMVGTGFVVQGAVATQNDRIVETQMLADAANRDILQLDAHGGVLEARAVKKAEDTLAVSTSTIAAAQGKADAGQLAASVAALENYKLLAPERVFDLVEQTTAHTVTVQAAVAEADRVAAEQAAAAA